VVNEPTGEIVGYRSKLGGVHSERPFRVRVKVQGSLLTVKHVNKAPDGAPAGGGVRGEVFGFSASSRKCMLDRLAVIDWSKVNRGSRYVASFWTGTYAGLQEDLPTPQQMERHRRAFAERLRRRFPRVWAFWRKEFNSSGEREYHPHLHALLFNLPGGVKDTLDRWWSEIVGEEWYSSASCSLEWVRTRNGATWYLAKYCAKGAAGLVYSSNLHGELVVDGVQLSDGDAIPTGRVWGIHNREAYQAAQAPEVAVEVVAGPWLVDFKRLARHKWAGVNGNGWAGFSLYVENGERWLELALSCASGCSYSGLSASEGVGCLLEIAP
jgi:hypothetical protein